MLEQVKPAVVSIQTTTSRVVTNELLEDPNVRTVLGIPDGVLIVQRDATAAGSGVVIDRENGYIVTSSHLVVDGGCGSRRFT